jgi:hypothetical protein
MCLETTVGLGQMTLIAAAPSFLAIVTAETELHAGKIVDRRQ